MERDLPELAVDRAVWMVSYELAGRARRRGITAPATDLLVAACARHHGVNVEHDDEHLAALIEL